MMVDGQPTAPLDVVVFFDPRLSPHPSGPDAEHFGGLKAQWDILSMLAARPDAVRLSIISTPQGVCRLRERDSETFGTARVIDMYRAAELDLGSKAVIHHVGQSFDAAPYRLRRMLGVTVPVTSSHHSLGYAHLPAAAHVALREPQPGDALFASSRAARHILAAVVAAEAPEWSGAIELVGLPAHGRPTTTGERVRARHEQGIDERSTVLLSFGRITRQDKATLEPLLWSLTQLSAIGEGDLVLVIAGDDRHGYGRELQRQAAEMGVGAYVRVIGTPNDEQRAQLHHTADVFVGLFDSHQESFGLAVAEAQLAGLPVIVSDFSGAGELVENGRTGLCVPTSALRADELAATWRDLLDWREEHLLHAQLLTLDRQVLLGALRLLIGDPELRRQMGHRAAEVARQRHSPDSVFARHLDAWQRSLSAQRSIGRQTAADRRFDAPAAFASFASEQVTCGSISWQPVQQLDVARLLDEDLRAIVGDRVLADVVQVLRVRRSIELWELAEASHASHSQALLSVILLRKYGYVQVNPGPG